MNMCKEYVFNPNGKDLRKVMYFFGIPLDNQIVCPFHDDNRPSCHVDYDSGIFHCFACGASGNAFDFVRYAFPKINVIKQLQRYNRILKSKKVKPLNNMKFRSTGKRQKILENREYYEELAHHYFFGNKRVDWKRVDKSTREYMQNRGFTSKTLIEHDVRLTITNEYYPYIFPIYDMDIFRGYVCRTTNKRVEQRAKYLYNTGFTRNDTLGGRYDNEVVVLCEGFLDKLKLNQFGLTHVACIFGWKITSKQIDKLKARGVKYIISALDLDGPGRKGTRHLENYFDVIPFQFPKYVTDDNGDYVLDKNGRRKLLKDPGDLVQSSFDIAYSKTKALYRKHLAKKRSK